MARTGRPKSGHERINVMLPASQVEWLRQQGASKTVEQLIKKEIVMSKHWSEIFGNYVSAAELVNEVKNSGLDMETWLHETYCEMYPNDPRPNFSALSKQVVSEWAEKVARDAVAAADGDGTPVEDSTVVWLNGDGSYSVTDNGEEVGGLDADEAVKIIMENLGA